MALLLVFLLPGCLEEDNPRSRNRILSPVTEETATGTIEIADPEEIEYPWSHYLYDGISTILNGKFSDPAAMKDKGELVRFALVRFVKDGVVPSNPSDAQDTREIEIHSVRQVEKKIKEYFNIDIPIGKGLELSSSSFSPDPHRA